MNIYKISFYSKCGSYFESYLKSVTVIATSKEHALEIVRDWSKKYGNSFIYPQEKWNIELITEYVPVPQVIDYEESSDY